MAGAVPDLASGSVGSAHHLWVGRGAFGWLLWISWQTGLLYDSNDIQVIEIGGVGVIACVKMLQITDCSCCQHARNGVKGCCFVDDWCHLIPIGAPSDPHMA